MKDNQAIAKIFYEMAQYLEMDSVAFKPQAYEKAADFLGGLDESVKNLYQKGGLKTLEKLPGIGKGIAEKIEEYLKTGKIKEYENYKKKMPVDLEALNAVPGIGPKMIKELYQSLKIKNLTDLEKAASQGKIKKLPNFGEKTEQNILQGIEFLEKGKGRFLLGDIFPMMLSVKEELSQLKEVEEISEAGSIRRRKETIGDLDFLVICKNPEKVMDFFCALKGVEKIWDKGKTKSSVRMEKGFDMDLRIVPKKSYGAALQYFTGSKEHNVVLRKLAIEKGFKLNEYGLFKGAKMIAGATEQEIYKSLGLTSMPPEIREDRGEITATLRRELPELIELKDILGDLHIHSNWDGGQNSIQELADKAIKMGYQYIGIADHTKFLRIEHGLDEKQLLDRNKEIDEINKKFEVQGFKFEVLKGCEANIMENGSLDIENAVLAEMDFVIAGVHSQMKMPEGEMTERIIRAIRNPNVDIISHPTGRLIGKRDEFQIDFDKILKVAKENKTILEINASPMRLDLKDTNIKKAKEAGVKMIINTDTHELTQLNLMEYGVWQARRGWAEKKDIINSLPLEKLLRILKRR